MKKYKLIEYDPNQSQKIWPCGIWNSKEQALEAMIEEIKRSEQGCYYRIEEVEESIMDRVKSYEDAYQLKGLKKQDVAEMIYHIKLAFDADRAKHYIAMAKLETLIGILNEGWKPDWKDCNQQKWYVRYFTNSEQYDVYDITCMMTQPSSLYFKSRELAEYAAKQFKELYRQLLL